MFYYSHHITGNRKNKMNDHLPIFYYFFEQLKATNSKSEPNVLDRKYVFLFSYTNPIWSYQYHFVGRQTLFGGSLRTKIRPISQKNNRSFLKWFVSPNLNSRNLSIFQVSFDSFTCHDNVQCHNMSLLHYEVHSYRLPTYLSKLKCHLKKLHFKNHNQKLVYEIS